MRKMNKGGKDEGGGRSVSSSFSTASSSSLAVAELRFDSLRKDREKICSFVLGYRGNDV